MSRRALVALRKPVQLVALHNLDHAAPQQAQEVVGVFGVGYAPLLPLEAKVRADMRSAPTSSDGRGRANERSLSVGDVLLETRAAYLSLKETSH